MNSKVALLIALMCATAAVVVRADATEVDAEAEMDAAAQDNDELMLEAQAEAELEGETEVDTEAQAALSAEQLVHMHSTVWGADACATRMIRGYDYNRQFAEFCRSFKKVYPASTYPKRLAIFQATVNCIAAKNAELKRLGRSYTLRLNHMSDETAAEFNKRLGTFNVVWDKVVGAAKGAWTAVKRVFGYKFRQLKQRSLDATDAESTVEAEAEAEAEAEGEAEEQVESWTAEDVKDAYSGKALDWRTKNVVGAVGSQGRCGNCWAFSASSAAESAWAVAGNNLKEIAVQHLMDCAFKEGGTTNQCSGGVPGDGLNEVMKKGGFCAEKDVEYKAAPGTCNNSCKKVLQLSSVNNFYDPNKKEEQLFQLLQNGPVSVCIFAHSPTFMQYGGGVYDDPAGQPADNKINHAVLLVGYGTDAALGKDYWIIMNSWASKWGENGFIRIVRNKNSCLIRKQWMQPKADKAAKYGITEDATAAPTNDAAATPDVCTSNGEQGKCLADSACRDTNGRISGSCNGRDAGVVCCLPARPVLQSTPPKPVLKCNWQTSAYPGKSFQGKCVALSDMASCPSKKTVESVYCKPMATVRCCLDKYP